MGLTGRLCLGMGGVWVDEMNAGPCDGTGRSLWLESRVVVDVLWILGVLGACGTVESRFQSGGALD